MLKIVLENIEKKFSEELLFKQVSCSFESNRKYALLGINGSGKSTLLQIIAGYLSPSKGKVKYYKAEKEIGSENIFTHISICAPYMELIEEMTLSEFLTYHFSFKKSKIPVKEICDVIGLAHAENKPIEKFSSGMKQRVKLAQAFFSQTDVLLLDEPCMNLDEEGYKLFDKLMKEYAHNRIVIVASNDEKEIVYCEQKYALRDFK